jgi:YHS domain-containing protein
MRFSLKSREALLILMLFACGARLARGGEAAASELLNKDSAGVALKGYDPVSYFAGDKPVKGRSEFQYEWMGARWLFSTAANRDLFISDPAKYAPQYGGFCAYAVSKGHTADVNPNIWKIVDGKLYLNKNWLAGKLWNGDIPGNITKADKNWPEIVSKQSRNRQ